MPKYDLAVIGAGLGGLAVAALAARGGRKTIVIEQNSSAGGVLEVYAKDGFVFSPGPHLSFGFEREGTIHKLGESLGIALNASLYSPCYQVALPDRRITVYAEQSETVEELRREFTHEIDRIAKFYQDLRAAAVKSVKSRISNFLLQRKKAGGFIRRYRFSPEFIAFLDVQSLFFFRRRAEDIPLSSLIAMSDTSPYAVHDGFKKIADQLVEVILKNEGEIRYGVPFSEITLKKGRDVTLSTSQGPVDAGAVLLNTEQQKQGTVFFLGVRDDVVPAAMLQNVLCLPDYSRREEMFALSLGAKEDESSSPKGTIALTASFPLHSAFQTNDELVHQISSVIPFLDDFIVLTEEHKSVSRAFAIPEWMQFKLIHRRESHALLSRSSSGNTYLLGDGSGTPALEIAASQAFIERMR